jgi:hypothetical protein
VNIAGPANRRLPSVKIPCVIRMSVVDVTVACVCCGMYGVALASTVIGGFWTGPDFDHPPMSGLDCLLGGWFHYPIGWLANPLFFTGVALLLSRHRSSACWVGMCAIGCSVLWTCEFYQEFSAKLLLPGSKWWFTSMYALVAGSLCSIAVHYFASEKPPRSVE